MAGWHHQLDGHEFEWTPGDGDGQGGLACCDLWGRKESDRTERLNWTELNWYSFKEKADCIILSYSRASLVTHIVRNLSTMWETWVQSLGWEDPLEEGMVTHSSILAWRIPMDKGAWRAAVHGVTKNRTSEQLSTAKHSILFKMKGEYKRRVLAY